jgi:UDP-N-acetyl-D-mannosaminuronate dehydrogenase
MYEWTLLAEKIGVNLFEIVESIRVRKGTHDNMRYPGFGVGGYCLTKDSLLAQWSATTLFKTGIELRVTLEALRINNRMPLHTLDLAIQLAGGSLVGVPLAVAGISYLAEVADTRNSPTEILIDEALRIGANAVVTDPYLARWKERSAIPMADDLDSAIAGAQGIIFTIAHKPYRELTAEELRRRAPRARFIIDGFDVIADATAGALHAAGIRVAGVGKGHWLKRGYHL